MLVLTAVASAISGFGVTVSGGLLGLLLGVGLLLIWRSGPRAPQRRPAAERSGRRRQLLTEAGLTGINPAQLLTLRASGRCPDPPVGGLAATLTVVSAADGWDLTVPEDGSELLAELRRHGVRPGQRLHVVPASAQSGGRPDETASAEDRPRRRLSFTATGDGESDLARNTDEYLKGFGQA
ncbi:hypothetical protein [Goekera deserti]|uniref:hypothetical protein n=1 Tax=Goekera deserti TaxID=2497753 RepID=UPI00192F0D2F|nr:hypothetical protein [Goekera deserti]